jgi:hypothetical protein
VVHVAPGGLSCRKGRISGIYDGEGCPGPLPVQPVPRRDSDGSGAVAGDVSDAQRSGWSDRQGSGIVKTGQWPVGRAPAVVRWSGDCWGAAGAAITARPGLVRGAVECLYHESLTGRKCED